MPQLSDRSMALRHLNLTAYYDPAGSTRETPFALARGRPIPTVLVYDYHRKSPQPHVRQRALDLEEHHVLSIRRALDAGVKVVAGTDAGGHGHPANAGELVCLVRSGMTPMQAIQAGTSWAAECIGWKDRIGTVEKGKLADLIVVDGDPLAEIKVLMEPARIALIIKDGAIAANRMKPSR
jgi:imidazolonepropionase-like amidohydrolase